MNFVTDQHTMQLLETYASNVCEQISIAYTTDVFPIAEHVTAFANITDEIVQNCAATDSYIFLVIKQSEDAKYSALFKGVNAVTISQFDDIPDDIPLDKYNEDLVNQLLAAINFVAETILGARLNGEETTTNGDTKSNS